MEKIMKKPDNVWAFLRKNGKLWVLLGGALAGIVLMLLGVIIALGFTLTSLKMLVIICILWLTSPVSGHLIGRMEITINDELEKDMMVLGDDMVRHEKEGD